jgi:hypothetical protein
MSAFSNTCSAVFTFERNARRILSSASVCMYALRVSCNTFKCFENASLHSILNVRLCTAAGISPFQNGLCERVHAITNMMLIKLASENKNVEIETLLSWANMARNSLQMWNGFSSHQLVFGKNLNLPNIMQAELPAF